MMVCSHVSVSFVGGRWCCVGCGEVVDYVGSGASEEFLRLYGSESGGMSWDLIWRLRLRGLVPPVGVGGQSVEQVELLGRLRDLLAEVDVVDGFIRDRARAEVGGSVVSCEVFEIPRHVQDKINESFVRGEVDRAGR